MGAFEHLSKQAGKTQFQGLECRIVETVHDFTHAVYKTAQNLVAEIVADLHGQMEIPDAKHECLDGCVCSGICLERLVIQQAAQTHQTYIAWIDPIKGQFTPVFGHLVNPHGAIQKEQEIVAMASLANKDVLWREIDECRPFQQLHPGQIIGLFQFRVGAEQHLNAW